MQKINGIVLLGLVLGGGAAMAQDYQRRANILGGDPFRGKCTLEAQVDGAAEIEVRGDGANIRTLQGQPATIRRFECSAPLPRNPAEFRFIPVGGRGRQQLLRPGGGDGPAVVRIEDPQGGAGVYVFDLVWSGGGERRGGDFRPVEGPRPAEVAIQRCRERVENRLRQDGWGRVEVRTIRADDGPGRNDWVIGRAFGDRGDGTREFEFSCNVDLRDGDVRSVDVRRVGERPVDGGPRPAEVAIQRCRERVSDRLREDGWRRVEVRTIRVDDGPGRRDWVIGRAFGERGDGPRELEFSCNVDLRDGEVRSVDVHRVGERR